MGASPDLNHAVTFRRALTPVFVFKRYPRNYWLVLDAICEIAGYFPTAALGTYALSERTELARRTIRRILSRLETDGVLQLVQESAGGRFSADERRGAPGRANVYAVGPAYRNLPLKLPTRAGAKMRLFERAQFRAGTRAEERAQFRAGSVPKERAQFCATTHGLSGDVRVFKTGLGEVGGDGGGRRTTTHSSDHASPTCRYCYAVGTHHDWCQALNAGWVTNPPKES